jgi:hypothetical protein
MSRLGWLLGLNDDTDELNFGSWIDTPERVESSEPLPWLEYEIDPDHPGTMTGRLFGTESSE